MISKFIRSLQIAMSIYPWIKEIIVDVENLWDLEALSTNYSFDSDFYKIPSTDFPNTNEILELLVELSKKVPNSVVKMNHVALEEAHVYLTKTAHRKNDKLVSGVYITDYKQGFKVTTREIQEKIFHLIHQQNIAKTNLQNRFRSDLNHLFSEKYGHLIFKLIEEIKNLDVYTTLAHFVKINGYCKPSISKTENGGSVYAKNLRHPILEYVHTDEKFIPNTVSLYDETHGYMVYGLNSAGKSTLLRAIGLSVYMAQIGMFVPCTQFDLQCFTRMLTKITNMDDMYEKQSTFMFEMSELKHILSSTDSHSLVLCDELTSGTETLSATGIMASSILTLLEKKCRFMMTTHLHTMDEFPEIIENPNLHICHFKVHVHNNLIQYDRQLEEGMGDSLYGIEIINAIGFDSEFTNRAMQFRNRISKTKTIFDHTIKRSRYNSRLIVDECMQCGSTKDLHTHHIRQQKESDAYGMIDNEFHKNKLHNLMVLCQSCHHKLHHNHL